MNEHDNNFKLYLYMYHLLSYYSYVSTYVLFDFILNRLLEYITFLEQTKNCVEIN